MFNERNDNCLNPIINSFSSSCSLSYIAIIIVPFVSKIESLNITLLNELSLSFA